MISTFLDAYKANYQKLLSACERDALALIECKDAKTGELRAVLCVVDWDGEEFIFTPLGHLCPGNPFDAYLPPHPDGGFES